MISEYVHESNRSKPYVDWRQKENRMEGFLRWLKWRMDWCDLDHYACNNAYRDHARMTKEQQYWFSLIFGMTYQSEMAWVIFSNFPEIEKIDLHQLDVWNRSTLDRQWYAKDTKYNKGRIVSQVESILTKVKKHGSLTNWLEGLLISGDEDASFDRVYNEVMTLHKFGRMTTWIACQVLYETAGLMIRPTTMLAWDESSWSVRSGLYYVYGKDESIEAHSDVKFDPNDIPWIKEKEIELLHTCKKYLGQKHESMISQYLIESHLCQYKKLMLGGDYAGHSSGDHVSRATWLRDKWPDVDFSPFFDVAMMKHSPLVRGKVEVKAYRDLCMLTGQMINLHDDFDDMPNMYDELNVSPDEVNPLVIKSAIDSYINNSNTIDL